MKATDSMLIIAVVGLLTAAVLLLSGCGGKGGRTFLNVRPGGIVDAYVVDLDPATSTLQDVETQNNLSTAADTDGDWLKDDVELALGTDPNNRDTDGDGPMSCLTMLKDRSRWNRALTQMPTVKWQY